MSSSSEKSSNPSVSSQSATLSSTVRYEALPLTRTTVHAGFFARRSAVIEEQATIQLVDPTQVKIIDKQTLIEDNPESLLNALLEKDKELNRVLHEKEMLLSRLLNIPQSQMKDTPGNVRTVRQICFASLSSSLQIASGSSSKPNSSLEAITNAASCRNDLSALWGEKSSIDFLCL